VYSLTDVSGLPLFVITRYPIGKKGIYFTVTPNPTQHSSPSLFRRNFHSFNGIHFTLSVVMEVENEGEEVAYVISSSDLLADTWPEQWIHIPKVNVVTQYTLHWIGDTH
jgi:hypothetical protein